MNDIKPYADLRGANLKDTNLVRADLRGADLRGAYLEDADLRGADLEDADLRGADLVRADLKDVNLKGVDLRGANLVRADLEDADLRGADLEDADLRGADLRGAYLKGANLEDIKISEHTTGVSLACPAVGSFIAYKRAGHSIVTLKIPADARRSSATSLKCRCDKAFVLDIQDIDTGDKHSRQMSSYDLTFIYEVGKMVEVKDFDNDRWNECAPGIHFFMNREVAVQY